MKKLLLLTIFFTVAALHTTNVRAQDLSMRQAAYFQFTSDGKINLKSPYVTPGKTFKINKGATTLVSGDGFKFAVGFLINRDQTNFPPAGFKVSLSSGSDSHTLVFQFANGEKIVQAHHETPYLKMGMNKLKVTIDPENKVAETNESNNSFEFNIEVVDDSEMPKTILKLPKKN